MLTTFLVHFTTAAAKSTGGGDVVTKAVDTLSNTLKGWALPIATVCAIAGALLWMIAGSTGSTSHGAHGIRAVIYAIAGVFIAFSALSLVSIGKTIAGG